MVLHRFAAFRQLIPATARRCVAVAGAADVHALEAVLRLAQEGLIDYLLAGPRQRVAALADELGLAVDAARICDAADDAAAAACAVRLVREGAADILMKGGMQTATLLRAVVHPQSGIRSQALLSHVALLELPGYHKLLALTDGGMLPSPNAEQKRRITANAARLLRQLGYDCPKVAALAAVETPNPKLPSAMDALQLKEWNNSGALPGCIVEGPISFDLMFSREAAAQKGYHSPVTGDTDILLVPDMTAGNLLCKAMIYTAGARMAGVIAGARVPVVLVSRSAAAEEKRDSILLAAACACAPPAEDGGEAWPI